MCYQTSAFYIIITIYHNGLNQSSGKYDSCNIITTIYAVPRCWQGTAVSSMVLSWAGHTAASQPSHPAVDQSAHSWCPWPVTITVFHLPITCNNLLHIHNLQHKVLLSLDTTIHEYFLTYLKETQNGYLIFTTTNFNLSHFVQRQPSRKSKWLYRRFMTVNSDIMMNCLLGIKIVF